MSPKLLSLGAKAGGVALGRNPRLSVRHIVLDETIGGNEAELKKVQMEIALQKDNSGPRVMNKENNY